MTSHWRRMFRGFHVHQEQFEELEERTHRNARARLRQLGEQHSQIESLEQRVDDLENDLGRTILYLRAAIEMLKQNEAWDEDRFNQALFDIDGADGEYDGKTSLDESSE